MFFLKVGNIIGQKFRKLKNFYFRLTVSPKISSQAVFWGKGIIIRGCNISIGDKTTLNNYVILNAGTFGKIKIGANCRISDAVKIIAVGLDKNKKHLPETVEIKDGVWLATGCIVLPGVVIGENSIVGAGAVVTKNVPPNMVVAGVPAKIIREIL